MWLERRSFLAIFAVPVLYAALIYVPFHNTEPRYSSFALPFLYLFAAVAIGRFWAHFANPSAV